MSVDDLKGFNTFPISKDEFLDLEKAKMLHVLSQSRVDATSKLLGCGNTLKDLEDFYKDKIPNSYSDLKKEANKIYESVTSLFELELRYKILFSKKTIVSEIQPYLFISEKELEMIIEKHKLQHESIPSYCIFWADRRIANSSWNLSDISLDGYTYTSILGEGAMGLVSKVEKDGVFYASKCFKDDADCNEVDVLFRLDHPNLVQGKAMVLDKLNRLNIILPLAVGDLEKVKIKTEEKFAVMYQLTSALHFLHKQGLYHCDLKPQNVLCFKDEKSPDTVKACISDFGWTYSFYADQPICGTPGFSSPQGWESHPDKPFFNEKIDHVQSDIYSLGTVFFYMWTKKRLNTYDDLEQSYEKAEDKVMEYFLKETDKDKRDALRLIYDMVRAKQSDRLKTTADIFNSKCFRNKALSEPIPGRTKTHVTNICDTVQSFGRTGKQLIKPMTKYIFNLCTYFDLTWQQFIIALRLCFETLTLAQTPDELEFVGIICLHIACELTYLKYGIKTFCKMAAKPIDKGNEMMFKIIFKANGLLNNSDIFDLAVSSQELAWYIDQIFQDCNVLHLKTDQELHFTYVNSVEKDVLARKSKIEPFKPTDTL